MRPRSHAAPLLGLAACLSLGCANNAPPKQPEGTPPTPATVTRENPGGDAADPIWAALDRLATEPLGSRTDKWQSLAVPLMDAPKWRRVRIFGYPTRASYRYGDEHYAVATVWYTKTDGPNDPASCLARFNGEAMAAATRFGVVVSEPRMQRTTQDLGDRRLPVVIAVLDGSVDSMLANDEYVGAVAAYQSWPGTCLVQGFAVVATTHRELAEAVRDRWVEEAASALFWKVDAPPETLTR